MKKLLHTIKRDALEIIAAVDFFFGTNSLPALWNCSAGDRTAFAKACRRCAAIALLGCTPFGSAATAAPPTPDITALAALQQVAEEAYLYGFPMLVGYKALYAYGYIGSRTTGYIQKDSPGKDKEANWLPAPDGPMFIVMRLYWPKTAAPSVYPLGKGSWQPPAIVPVTNRNAQAVRRFGDKSLENVVRTDERYGHDGLFQGPRGWVYWNRLENPKPIQSPNLWPDTQSTYFLGRLAMPAGSSLTLNYTYPHARYFQFALYKAEGNTFVSTGEALAGADIEPDRGSVNPFRAGTDRLAEQRSFTLRNRAADPPADPQRRAHNTLYAGKDSGELQFVNRIYLADQGWDGAGWGPADASRAGRGLPAYSGKLADINNRKPGELYLVGGEYPTLSDPNPAGPFVAKADATTGKQIWRTYLDNPNASGRWIGNANLNILDNGRIVFAWSNHIVLLDADSGAILKHNTLPAGDAPIADVNFKHLTVAPDRTLILKDQTRPTGCTLQGTMAIIKCGMQGMKQPNSQLVAVDPDTLEVLHDIPLPEPSSVPLQKGQTTATAPSLIGDWVGFQLNGMGSDTVASSVVVANQQNPRRMNIVFPFGPLKKGEWSFCPPKAGADPENGMLFSADMGIGKVAGIKLDQATGKLKTVFVLDDMTTTFQPLIGPKEERVLLLTNMRLNAPHEPIKAALFTENYKEQLTWRDAASGRLLAASDFFPPLSINGLTPPGFGGRVYFPTAVGKGFMVLQVVAAKSLQ